MACRTLALRSLILPEPLYHLSRRVGPGGRGLLLAVAAATATSAAAPAPAPVGIRRGSRYSRPCSRLSQEAPLDGSLRSCATRINGGGRRDLPLPQPLCHGWRPACSAALRTITS